MSHSAHTIGAAVVREWAGTQGEHLDLPRMLLRAPVLVALATVSLAASQDHGPAVGRFKLAPVESVLGAYRNDSLNSWGGALVHTPEDPHWPCVGAHVSTSWKTALIRRQGRQRNSLANSLAHLLPR